jgi:hypothetical protein
VVLIDEQSGSSAAALTTTEAALITLASVTVAQGDRVMLLYDTLNTAGAATTEINISCDQSAGTGVGTWFVAGGSPTTGTATFAFTHAHADVVWGASGAVWVYVTGSGTMTFQLRGVAAAGNAASGTHRLTALVFRP